MPESWSSEDDDISTSSAGILLILTGKIFLKSKLLRRFEKADKSIVIKCREALILAFLI